MTIRVLDIFITVLINYRPRGVEQGLLLPPRTRHTPLEGWKYTVVGQVRVMSQDWRENGAIVPQTKAEHMMGADLALM